MTARRLVLASCTGLILILAARPGGASTEPASIRCQKLQAKSAGPVPVDLISVCKPEAVRKVKPKPPTPQFVNQGPILVQEASTDTMNSSSVATISTLIPFGAVGTAAGDFPADVELLTTDPVHAYQLSTLGAASRMDSVGAVVALPNNPPPGGQGWTDMATDPTTGIVYAAASICNTVSSLSTVNLLLGTSAPIGTITNSPCLVGLAFTNTGLLYGYDIVNDSLISINKVTGAGTIVGPLGFDANFGQSMDCDPGSGTCYLFSFNVTTFQAELRSVNLANGATTLVGVIGSSSPGDAQAAGAVFGTIGVCNNDADCNDGNLCNGLETCVNTACVAGTPVNCDDGDFCTDDACDPPTGTCSYSPNTCDDADPCTVDSCNSATGCSNQNVCQHYCNTGSIQIVDAAAGSPYPSVIGVAGAGAVAAVGSVELLGVQHTFPDDVDMLLVGPGGQNAIIMSDVGGGTAAVGINLRLTDFAADPIPDGGPLMSGTFQPTNSGTGDTFPAPAPAPSGNTSLAIFSGLNPNGNWQLYIVDDAGIDSGTVAGGWCLNIVVTNCTTDQDCSDGNACNGTETCNGGQCVLGTPVNCDDGQFCTIDTCTPATGTCNHAPNPCSDGDACTVDTCDEVGDTCTHVDTCQRFCGSSIVLGPDSAPGSPYPATINVSGMGATAVLGRVVLQGMTHTFPDDDDFLLVGPAGQNATIMSDAGGGGDVAGITLTLSDGAATQLSDGGPLATGTFRPANYEPGDPFSAPAPPPSGNVALSTFDGTNPNGNWQLYVMDDAGGDTGTLTSWCVDIRSLGDACTPLPNCDDGNPCTDDSCNPASGCVHTPNTASCDDGNACTVGDVCGGGSCQPGGPRNCNDNNPCTDDSCNPTSGCVNTPNTAPCDDGNACTVGDVCGGGSCHAGGPRNCNDSNPCTDDSCNPTSGCVNTPNTAPCDDGNACTVGDVCGGGSCHAGGPRNCNDSNPCTDDSCNPTSGCVNTPNTAPCDDGNACTVGDVCGGGSCHAGGPRNCNDSNPCTDDSCNPTSGCVNTNNTAPCDDGNACTVSDVCGGGSCHAGTARNCNDNNACTDDTCNPASGCVNTNNTAPCSDGNACTVGDACGGGSCHAGTARNCNDNNACTDDSCNPASGCVNTPNTAPCDDGNACTVGDVCGGGSCHAGGPRNCNDGNACTDDSCNPASGCVSTPNTAPCEDGNACTVGDACGGGSCHAGGARNCNDGNPCTDDSCNPASGCVNTNNTAPCDDGNACTGPDACSGGSCHGGPNTCTQDCDNDGIPDDQDACPCGITSAVVIIDGCNTGVPNRQTDGVTICGFNNHCGHHNDEDFVYDDEGHRHCGNSRVIGGHGCNIADLIQICRQISNCPQKWAECVEKVTKELKNQHIITEKQRNKIRKCVQRAIHGGRNPHSHSHTRHQDENHP